MKSIISLLLLVLIISCSEISVEERKKQSNFPSVVYSISSNNGCGCSGGLYTYQLKRFDGTIFSISGNASFNVGDTISLIITNNTSLLNDSIVSDSITTNDIFTE